MTQAVLSRVIRPTGVTLEFEEFFRSEHRRLVAALYLLVGDRTEAEDLAQESLARAFERWARVREMASPAGYVYRIALNLSRKRFRRIGRDRPFAYASASSTDPTESADQRVVIRSAVLSLTREQREALVLVEWLELDSDEAGRVLRISAESVRARVHRAREVLRSRLGGPDE
jgi:RNA polymerase sigma factor (sigma-70 family)